MATEVKYFPSMTTNKNFGPLLRKLRTEADKSVGAVAEHLGTSPTYISGVEMGRHPPLADDKIRLVAEFLGVEPDALIHAKARDRGGYHVPPPTGKIPNQLLIQFARGDREWTDDDLVQELKRHGFIREGETK